MADREPETLDWTRRNYALTTHDEGQTAHLTCWHNDGRMPHVGDYLLLRNGDRSTRYHVEKVDWPWSEGDVCGVKVSFAPRLAGPADDTTRGGPDA